MNYRFAQTVLLSLIAWMMASPFANAASSNAEALLKEVLKARENVKSGEMEFKVKLIRTNEVNIQAHLFFSNNYIFNECTSETYFITNNASHSGEETQKKIEQLGYNFPKAASLGLLEKKPTESRGIFDGSHLHVYSSVSGTLRTKASDPSASLHLMLPNPRSLGLEETADGLFPPEKYLQEFNKLGSAVKTELVGEEILEGVKCWRTRIQSGSPFIMDLWIDQSHPLVHKVLYSNKDIGEIEVRSKYGPDFFPIPIEVRSQNKNASGAIYSKMELVISKSSYNIDVPQKQFELASLRMPFAQFVTDTRGETPKWGYWDGEKIVDSFPVKQGPSSLAASPPLPQPQPRDWRGLAYAAAGAGAVLLTLAILRVARSRTRNQT